MINILIMCPEITKGMKSLGSKSLLSLKKNLTLIEHQISQMQKFRPCSITINLGFDAERIQEKLSRYKTIKFFVNNNYKNTNHGQNIIDYIIQQNPKNLLIISSGLLIKNNLIQKKYLKNESKVFLLDKQKNNFTIGCAAVPKLRYLFYDMQEPWSEIVFLNNQAISLLKSYDKNIFSQMYLFEIINLLLDNNVLFNKIYVKKNNIMKINTIKDLATAKSFV